MRKTRWLCLFLAVCLCAGLLSGCTNNTESSSVVMTIGGTEVELDEYLYYLRTCKDSIEASFSTADGEDIWSGDSSSFYLQYAKSMAESQALTRVAIEQLCAEEGISLSEADRETIAANKATEIETLGGMAAYESALNSVSLTDRVYDLMAETSQLYALLDAHYYGEEGTRALSDEAFTEYFKEHYYTAHHILKATVALDTYTPLDEETIAQKKAEIDALLAQAKTGADFAALARDNSEDTGIEVYPEGYTFTEGEMLAPFYEATVALEEGEISEVVETDVGYHIIKRLPLDLSYCTENLAELRSAYYYNDFDALVSERINALEVSYSDDYDSIDMTSLS